jgi:Predicted aspartyl protease
MSQEQGEITITLTSLTGEITESIQVSSFSTTLVELCEFAVAILGMSSSSSQDIILLKNGQRLFENNANDSRGGQSSPISSVGIQNGDVLVVISKTQMQQRERRTSRNQQQTTRRAVESSNRGSVSSVPNRTSNSNSNGGLLDFSSLLGSGTTGGTVSTSSATTNANTTAGGGGNLLFQLPPAHLPMFHQTQPVQWNGMTLDDCIERNPNPLCFVKVLLSPNHPNLWKELNHHSPLLANKLKSAKNPEDAANIWKEQMQKSAMSSTLSRAMLNQKDKEMEQRLRVNPLDEEANKYFGEKIRKENVENQYQQMMEDFPESMGRVLMLYIDAQVNGHAVQAFVDSGAQTTIMSSACAERCGLLHLLDTRFSGVAVGVGTGKILGRVHIAEMKVKGLAPIFPCTITIMDESLGNKNMDFLLGLDMLKRHRCNINLDRNVLEFRVGVESLETPFLHEKDLSEAKGGTLGFDVEKSNKEVEKMMESQDKTARQQNSDASSNSQKDKQEMEE